MIFTNLPFLYFYIYHSFTIIFTVSLLLRLPFLYHGATIPVIWPSMSRHRRASASAREIATRPPPWQGGKTAAKTSAVVTRSVVGVVNVVDGAEEGGRDGYSADGSVVDASNALDAMGWRQGRPEYLRGAEGKPDARAPRRGE